MFSLHPPLYDEEQFLPKANRPPTPTTLLLDGYAPKRQIQVWVVADQRAQHKVPLCMDVRAELSKTDDDDDDDDNYNIREHGTNYKMVE